ncbi:hypothetical protein Gobs_2973 [Geodermatophilus obscurus DSM 43160]|uniref:Uncharacterized protein n=1 Tax=Geodermatophilus obscurus (strain ATCC 25078 / DSM 43160 / JCM 3152 / CCUG 61914 / KCC A-0152 / KCTC 9177 / NBRC 13315 / NRRL B-3577 / G-20) TaxID=526225 RepID=D2S8K3_GEOOG|nr:hypothetical protein Gobs_2973 [Geodermatophilus obscurus DSM 43160]
MSCSAVRSPSTSALPPVEWSETFAGRADGILQLLFSGVSNAPSQLPDGSSLSRRRPSSVTRAALRACQALRQAYRSGLGRSGTLRPLPYRATHSPRVWGSRSSASVRICRSANSVDAGGRSRTPVYGRDWHTSWHTEIRASHDVTSPHRPRDGSERSCGTPLSGDLPGRGVHRRRRLPQDQGGTSIRAVSSRNRCRCFFGRRALIQKRHQFVTAHRLSGQPAAGPAGPRRHRRAHCERRDGSGGVDPGRADRRGPRRRHRHRPLPGAPSPAGRRGALASPPLLGHQCGSRVRPKKTGVVDLDTSPPAHTAVIAADELGPVMPRNFDSPPG